MFASLNDIIVEKLKGKKELKVNKIKDLSLSSENDINQHSIVHEISLYANNGAFIILPYPEADASVRESLNINKDLWIPKFRCLFGKDSIRWLFDMQNTNSKDRTMSVIVSDEQ